jgi:hypothetical protein
VTTEINLSEGIYRPILVKEAYQSIGFMAISNANDRLALLKDTESTRHRENSVETDPRSQESIIPRCPSVAHIS